MYDLEMFSSRTPDGMLDAPLFDRFFLDPAPGAAVVDSSERRAERSSFASPSDVVAAEEDEREEVVRRQ